MARAIKYDETGNPVLVDGQFMMIDGLEELKQSLISIMSTPLGSLDYSPNVGMDYTFLRGKFDEQGGIDAITNACYQDKRVIRVNDVECQVDRNKGIAIFNISLSTTLGDLNFDEGVRTNAANG